MNVVALLGSPLPWSRPAWLVERAGAQLARTAGCAMRTLVLRELPPSALLRAELHHPALDAAIEQLRAADAVLLATPVYKGAYSGLLKAFLDLLPPRALQDKPVLALATASDSAQLPSLDGALRPVLQALGTQRVTSVLAADAQLVPHETRGYVADEALWRRFERALHRLQSPATAIDPALSTSVDAGRAAPAVVLSIAGRERVAAPAAGSWQ